jgi:MFS family permease
MSNLQQESGAINAKLLFNISIIALFTTGVSFSLRGATATDIKTGIFDKLDITTAGATIAGLGAIAFLSSSATILLISAFLDKLGMKTTLTIASIAMIVGTSLISFAHFVAPESAYLVIWMGMFITGIGWGCTEGTINPLATALYPNDTTHRLNVLHAWWPGGIIVGALLAYFLGEMKIPWYVVLVTGILPAAVYLVMLRGQTFPKTNSAQMGVSAGQSIAEAFRRPSVFVWLGIMLLTASTELAPGQWVDIALTQIVGMKGILLLAFVSGIMFVMRYFAGPIAHRISPVGLLLASSVFALGGLVLLSKASSPATALTAAAVWGMGVCFMWPTMMAVVADRYPRGGAWFLGLIASAGGAAIYFVLPRLGKIYDAALVQAAGGADKIAGLTPEQIPLAVKAQAAAASFEAIAVLPAILMGVFGVILVFEKLTGGFKKDHSAASKIVT